MQASKEVTEVWILQMNIYHKLMINTVYKKFLKFSKTSGNKRKQTWYDKAHVLNDKIKKGVFV